jgi:phosphatidate cytidylyltransferase
MAFNQQVFKTRALTAILFAVIMLAGLLLNQWSFFILFSIIHFGCWIEYQKLVSQIDPGYKEITPFHKYGVMLAGWCLMLWFAGEVFAIGELRLHEMGWWFGLVIAFLLPLTELLLTKNISLKNIGHSIFGLIYISLSLGLMIDLYGRGTVNPDILKEERIYNIYFPLIIIGCMWVNDTMAYIVGSLIGRTPLSKISPKKTWEGTVGGIILGSLIMGYAGWMFDKPFIFGQSLLFWIFLSVIASVAGTLGDLLESKLKRLAHVKDSGSFMPGHGGFLDRFDSLLLTIPFVWLYVKLFMK